MSIGVMTRVWEHSRASHGNLLVLLAIADFADDRGRAYPSVPTLERKSRLSERGVQNALKALVALGELRIVPGAGPNGTNLYTVTLSSEGAKSAPPQNLRPPPQILRPMTM